LLRNSVSVGVREFAEQAFATRPYFCDGK